MWTSQRQLCVLYKGSFDSLSHDIQKFVFEKEEPEGKQQYYKYYKDMLSINKNKAHLNAKLEKVPQIPCSNPFQGNMMKRIFEDIQFMKKTKEYVWDLSECLRNESEESLNNIFELMNTLIHLEEIDLSFNNFKVLPEGFGNAWSKLQVIDLSRTQLSQLPQGFGNAWGALRYIDLSETKLTEFRPSFGNAWGALQHIILSHTQLTQLPQGARDAWPANVKIRSNF